MSRTILSFFFVLSLARIAALHVYYRAPEELLRTFARAEIPRLAIASNTSAYADLAEQLELMMHKAKPEDIITMLSQSSQKVNVDELAALDITICYGSEWYRFPSHFFLPEIVNFAFIKSDFNGILPRPFDVNKNNTGVILAARQTGLPFNDHNKEEFDRYVRQCPSI